MHQIPGHDLLHYGCGSYVTGNIYVLGPMMALPVLRMVWNLAIQGALAGAALRHMPFWVGLANGPLA